MYGRGKVQEKCSKYLESPFFNSPQNTENSNKMKKFSVSAYSRRINGTSPPSTNTKNSPKDVHRAKYLRNLVSKLNNLKLTPELYPHTLRDLNKSPNPEAKNNPINTTGVDFSSPNTAIADNFENHFCEIHKLNLNQLCNNHSNSITEKIPPVTSAEDVPLSSEDEYHDALQSIPGDNERIIAAPQNSSTEIFPRESSPNNRSHLISARRKCQPNKRFRQQRVVSK